MEGVETTCSGAAPVLPLEPVELPEPLEPLEPVDAPVLPELELDVVLLLLLELELLAPLLAPDEPPPVLVPPELPCPVVPPLLLPPPEPLQPATAKTSTASEMVWRTESPPARKILAGTYLELIPIKPSGPKQGPGCPASKRAQLQAFRGDPPGQTRYSKVSGTVWWESIPETR